MARPKKRGNPRHQRGVFDSRIAATEVRSGPPDLEGAFLVRPTHAVIPEVGRIRFVEPVLSYIYLDDARDAERRGSERLTALRRSMRHQQHAEAPEANERQVIDVVRHGSRACILALAAVETFASEIIKPDAAFERRHRKKDEIQRLDRKAIGDLGIDERISDALPAVLDRPSIKGTKLGAEFTALRKLRNAVVHPPATAVRTSAGQDDPTRVWDRLLRGEFLGVCATAEHVIEHFSPGWITNIKQIRAQR